MTYERFNLYRDLLVQIDAGAQTPGFACPADVLGMGAEEVRVARQQTPTKEPPRAPCAVASPKKAAAKML